MIKTIASRENPAFKAWKKLAQSGRERKKQRQALLEGVHLVESWHTAYGMPVCLLASEKGSTRTEIVGWLAAGERQGVECVVLTDALFAELADTETPGGLIALVNLPDAQEPPAPDADSLLLDGVQDPGNLGSLLRTAAAAGFAQVLLSADCASPWSPKTLRAGQGAHFQLQLHENADLPAFLEAFQGIGLATTLEDAESLYDARFGHQPLAWVFGSEGQGVSRNVLAAAQKRIHIPMPGAKTVESLNVGNAAAICLFETLRRRQFRCQVSGDR
ncbi:RNA methyltransferase [Betaproteobacteria bacterium]|nr:RNA methyltransferase [Betaproteobacteria bacterium]GHU44998.1 RNA methyltransferase [Betaproteobacteria bacterium]